MEMFGFGVPNKIRDIVGPKKLDVVSSTCALHFHLVFAAQVCVIGAKLLRAQLEVRLVLRRLVKTNAAAANWCRRVLLAREHPGDRNLCICVLRQRI